jgi:hypothetical protein
LKLRVTEIKLYLGEIKCKFGRYIPFLYCHLHYMKCLCELVLLSTFLKYLIEVEQSVISPLQLCVPVQGT